MYRSLLTLDHMSVVAEKNVMFLMLWSIDSRVDSYSFGITVFEYLAILIMDQTASVGLQSPAFRWYILAVYLFQCNT